MPSTVVVALDGPVRRVTLNRPEKRNALDSAMLEALAAAFPDDPPADERLTLLRAEGPVFCAGIDLRERLERGASGPPIETVLHRIESYPLPVVAAVHGDAIAGGCELALHCDLVVASESARFGMSLAQIGLAPSWDLGRKLVDVLGPVVAREILLLGDPVPSRRLYEIGAIARCVPPARFEEAVEAVVSRLAANAPLSLRAMKAMLVRQMAFRDTIPHEDVDELVRAARASEDAREGMAARLERRQPRFRGR